MKRYTNRNDATSKEEEAHRRMYHYRYRAKRRGLECTITDEWIVEHIYNSSCTYCGETDWKELECDRIDNNVGYVPENILCSCHKCNNLRSDKYTVEEFRERLKLTPEEKYQRNLVYKKRYYEEHRDEILEAMRQRYYKKEGIKF